MNVLQALILGIVQGLTEFLPISSSAHLVFVPALLRIPSNVAFDALLHLGTLAAVIAYFWRDVLGIIGGFFQSLADIPAGRFSRGIKEEPRKRLAWLVIVGSIPAAVLGYLFKGFFERLFQSVPAAAVLLVVTGLILWAAELGKRGQKKIPAMSLSDGLAIGLAQAVAIAPGISRSGATISAGLFLSLDRELAARFSFLLAIPAILGAAALEYRGILAGFHLGASMFLTGLVSAAVCGWLAIRILMKIIRTKSLRIFAVYCWLAGGAALALYFLKIL